MKRLVRIAVIACAVGALAAPAFAEVKTRDKTQVKFEGMLGRMLSLFGGKAAKEGSVQHAQRGVRRSNPLVEQIRLVVVRAGGSLEHDRRAVRHHLVALISHRRAGVRIEAAALSRPGPLRLQRGRQALSRLPILT